MRNGGHVSPLCSAQGTFSPQIVGRTALTPLRSGGAHDPVESVPTFAWNPRPPCRGIRARDHVEFALLLKVGYAGADASLRAAGLVTKAPAANIDAANLAQYSGQKGGRNVSRAGNP